MSEEVVKPGYKRTEVGVIPEDWDVFQLQDITNVKTGPFGSSLHEKDYVNDGTPIITVEHLSENGVVHCNLPMVSDSDKERLKAYILEENDVVFSRVGSVDRNSIIGKKEIGWLFSGRLLRVRPKTKILFSPFLSYQFHSEPFKNRIRGVAVGQTMASLNTQILNSIEIFLPPLPEQNAIAAALSDADGLIGALETLIAKKRAIKQAAMQQLLTGRTRLPGFEGKWDTLPLKLFVREFIVPMRDKPKRLTGAIPWCRIEDFDGIFLKDSKSGQYVDNQTIQQMNLKVYPIGTLLVSCSADLGRCAIVGRPLVSNQTFIGLFMDESVVSILFFYYYMISQSERLNNLSSGTTISYLSREQFENFIVTIPLGINEQTAIATVLSDMDAEITALEQRLEKTRQIKQGMMQQLLTGKVRLVTPQEAEAAV